jgi:hypothetical protein
MGMTKIVVDVTGAIKRAEKILAKKIAKRDALNAEIADIQAKIEAVKAATEKGSA